MIDLKLVDEDTVELDLEGEVSSKDYQKITPELEKIFREKGKMKFLFILRDVKDFTLGAIFQDLKFDLSHFKNIGATAIVGGQKSIEFLTKTVDKIYPENIQHFEKKEAALRWLQTQIV